MRRNFVSSIRAAAIVVALVLAQTAAVAHVDFDDSHPAGESCAYCVGLATFAAGNVSATPTVAAVGLQIPLPNFTPQSYSGRPAEYRHARDPPVAS